MITDTPFTNINSETKTGAAPAGALVTVLRTENTEKG